MIAKEFEVTKDGVLSLTIQGEKTGPWALDFYLNIGRIPLYYIGTMCETCQAVFERVNTAKLPLTPEQLSTQLGAGLSTISQAVIDTMTALLPSGRYQVGLITMKPLLMIGQEPPVSLSCQADYYWLGHFDETHKGSDYELLLPIVPRSNLSEIRVRDYRAMFKTGQEPVALAFSMRDDRAVAGQFYQTTLAHFLLDGHHKVMAASQMSRSITLLSFLYLRDYPAAQQGFTGFEYYRGHDGH
jgi:hypothetical protein